MIELSETAPILATMLGLAVGIDYALFILARHKQNLADGMDVRESVAQANGTAGSAVVFAGMTVVIALVGLAVINIPFLTVMGLAAAGTVTIAVLIAITLLPAVFGFCGRAPRARPTACSPRAASDASARRSAPAGSASSRVIPIAVLLTGLALLTAAAIPATHMTARPAGRLLGADHVDRAPLVRPADRGLRPGLQRHADRRRRRAEVARAEQEAVRQATSPPSLQDFPGVAAVSPAMPNEAGRPLDRPGHARDRPGLG